MKVRSSSLLGSYTRSLRRFGPLSKEEEHSLALRARAGDVRAGQRLVEHGLAFVVFIASRKRRGAVPLEDLVQEGNLGLLRALDKFDPHAGTRFLTYAGWWIDAYIGRYLKNARSTVRSPSGTVARSDASLDATSGEDEGKAIVEDLMAEGPSPEEACAQSEIARQVREVLTGARAHLRDLAWDVVQRRMLHHAPRTLEEIGKSWGMTRERVRQIELETKRTLRRQLEKKRIRSRAAA